MYITSIIITYNRLKLSKLCVESYNETCPRDKCGLVVVDNHSTDGTCEWLKSIEGSLVDKIILNPKNYYLGRAWNIAKSIIDKKSVYVSKIDNDYYFNPGWYEAFCRVRTATNAGIIIVSPETSYRQKLPDPSSTPGYLSLPGDLSGAFFIHCKYPVKFIEHQRMTMSSNGEIIGAARRLGAKVVRLYPAMVTRKFERYSEFPEYYQQTFGQRGILNSLARRVKGESV